MKFDDAVKKYPFITRYTGDWGYSFIDSLKNELVSLDNQVVYNISDIECDDWIEFNLFDVEKNFSVDRGILTEKNCILITKDCFEKNGLPRNYPLSSDSYARDVANNEIIFKDYLENILSDSRFNYLIFEEGSNMGLVDYIINLLSSFHFEKFLTINYIIYPSSLEWGQGLVALFKLNFTPSVKMVRYPIKLTEQGKTISPLLTFNYSNNLERLYYPYYFNKGLYDTIKGDDIESKVSYLYIYDGIDTLPRRQFEGLPISELEIPKSVKNIGEGVFKNCKNLKKIIFNGTFYTFPLDRELFRGCESVEEIHLDKHEKTFFSDIKALFKKNKNVKYIQRDFV